MKIEGSNPYINLYRNQQQKQVVNKKEEQADKLNISEEAQKLQQHDINSQERANYVGEIKNQVQSGNYKVDVEKTAQKMIDFWSKR